MIFDWLYGIFYCNLLLYVVGVCDFGCCSFECGNLVVYVVGSVNAGGVWLGLFVL